MLRASAVSNLSLKEFSHTNKLYDLEQLMRTGTIYVTLMDFERPGFEFVYKICGKDVLTRSGPGGAGVFGHLRFSAHLLVHFSANVNILEHLSPIFLKVRSPGHVK